MFSILPGISALIIFDHILLFSKEKVKKLKFDYFSITLYRTLLLKEIDIFSPKKNGHGHHVLLRRLDV